LLLFALGLMSKPMLVTVPFVLLLLDWWPLRRFNVSPDASPLASFWRLAMEKLPFLALSIASSVATLVVQKQAAQPLAHLALGIRAVNAIVTYVRYLYKMVCPVKLAIPYPHHGYAPFWLFCLCAALLLITSVAAVRSGRRFPFLVTGWFWYLAMLVPVIGLVQVGMQSMADRYTYLPLVGIFIVLVWTGAELAERWRLPGAVAGSVSFLLLTACAWRTMDQLRFWQNSGTLFSHAVAVSRGNDVAWYNLGEYYFSQKHTDRAIECYLKAVEIRPTYDDALNNLGVALAVRGRLDDAAARIRQAIRCRPDKADAHYNLGNVLVLQNRLADAVAAYTEALRLKPDYPEAHNNLANVFATQGRRDAAAQHYREALRLDPNHEGAKRGLRALGEPVP
jgi:tetratricopeptide (TPR) repeat protein